MLCNSITWKMVFELYVNMFFRKVVWSLKYGDPKIGLTINLNIILNWLRYIKPNAKYCFYAKILCTQFIMQAVDLQMDSYQYSCIILIEFIESLTLIDVSYEQRCLISVSVWMKVLCFMFATEWQGKSNGRRVVLMWLQKRDLAFPKHTCKEDQIVPAKLLQLMYIHISCYVCND